MDITRHKWKKRDANTVHWM